MPFLFFLLISFSIGFAQYSDQPQKESVSDLRSGIEIFRINNLTDETEVWLERTPNLDYFLRMKKDGDEEMISKMTSKEAKKLDMEFASKFLKCQYELPPSPENCKVTLKLTLKGEKQDVCGKDEKKSQEIAPFLKELQKRF